jgi:hypothetical protein
MRATAIIDTEKNLHSLKPPIIHDASPILCFARIYSLKSKCHEFPYLMPVLHDSPSLALEILAILNAAFCQVDTEATSTILLFGTDVLQNAA